VIGQNGKDAWQRNKQVMSKLWNWTNL